MTHDRKLIGSFELLDNRIDERLTSVFKSTALMTACLLVSMLISPPIYMKYDTIYDCKIGV